MTETRYLIEVCKFSKWTLYASTIDYGFASLYLNEAMEFDCEKVRIIEEKRKVLKEVEI